MRRTTKKTKKKPSKRDYYTPQFRVISADMFNASVVLCINLSEKQVMQRLINYINKKKDRDRAREEAFFKEVLEDLEGWDTTSQGRCIITDMGAVVLAKLPKGQFRYSMSVLVHELAHAVHYACRRRRIPLTEDTEEIYCYMLDHFVREALFALWD
jgi:hypothetical protein